MVKKHRSNQFKPLCWGKPKPTGLVCEKENFSFSHLFFTVLKLASPLVTFHLQNLLIPFVFGVTGQGTRASRVGQLTWTQPSLRSELRRLSDHQSLHSLQIS